MASHVIGPFLAASEPLDDAVVARLAGRTDWTMDTAASVSPFTGPRQRVPTRPKHSLGWQHGDVIHLARNRPAPAELLPRRRLAAISQGSGEAAGLLFGPLTPDSYGSGPYGSGPYGGEPL